MIRVENLHKRFKDVIAVEDVSFVANDGKITGLLGPNGAGKSTTLRMIYGLLKPDRGHVQIDGIDIVKDTLAAQRRIGVLPDSHGSYLRLTLRENMRYYGKLHMLAPDKIEHRISGLIDLLDMDHIADRYVEGFSNGERMKLALARSIIHDPANLFLDEPTNGLDVMSVRTVRAWISDLKQQGKCIVFSSHVMQEVAALCDHIVIIAKGRIAAQGSPEELKDKAGMEDIEDAFVALIEK
ncbi:MAG: ATP-binding cassette domain-containing protein [Candidatus Latescibacteria bacterium]|nr:ATP-binding cassette domain-containing protein [Candidatus Latescibacterota bacterium]